VRDAVHLGPTPPADGGPGTWMPAPRARDLALPAGALFDALQSAGADRGLLDAISALSHAERRRTLDVLKQTFSNSASSGSARRNFLEAFLEVMQEGEFQGLDTKTYERAVDQRFLVDIPVRVSWSALDGTWLKEAAQEPKLRANVDALQAPQLFRDRALFFYRGFEPLEVRGWYIAAKIDLLLGQVLRGLTAPIWLLFGKRAQPTEVPRADRWLQRIGLADTRWWQGLLRPAVLREPCFRQVVLLYRPMQGEDDDSPAPLVLKLFRDIPLADAEMVFPDRRLGIRTLDAVLMLITAVAAGPAVIKAASGGSGTAIALATVLGGYAVKLVGQYFQKRRQHKARLTATLYAKSQDNDVGVLQYLVDAAGTQSAAEVALVYHHLQDGGRSAAQPLDRRIEAWLRGGFDADADYDVQDALRRAEAFGLLRRSAEGVYEAVPGPEARAQLAARWRDLGAV